MIINTILLTVLTILVIWISELLNKISSKKFFPKHYKKIKETEKKLSDLKNLIRLTLLQEDKNTYQELQKEYAELYNSIFFQKIIMNLIFFIPILIYTPIVHFLFLDIKLLLPPINLIIFLIGLFYLLKFIVSLYKNFR